MTHDCIKVLGKNRGKKNMLYILDEPTTGLHAQDVEKVISCIRSIIDKKNTVIVIEHNPYLIKYADHIIDMGPGAGDDGGEIVARVVFLGLCEFIECVCCSTSVYCAGSPQ